MADKIIKPEILNQQPNAMWDADTRHTFEAKKRAAERDWDRVLLSPNQAVPQEFLPDLAGAIGRATRAFSAGEPEY